MSTITQKIAAILGIKSDIKDAINAKGGSLTAASPFTSYAAAISNLPSQSVPQDSSYYGIVQDASLTGQASGMKAFISQIKAYPNANIAAGGFAFQTQLNHIPAISGTVGALAFYGDTSIGTDTKPVEIAAGADIGNYAFGKCSNIPYFEIKTSTPAQINIADEFCEDPIDGESPTWAETHDPTEDQQSGYGQKQGNGLWICVPDGTVQAYRTKFEGYSFVEAIFNKDGSDEFYHEYDDGGGNDGPDPDEPIDE